MSIYYIEATINGTKVLYTLDCTTDVTRTLAADISSFPVEDGSNVSENIILQNETIIFNGYITDIKTLNGGSKLSTKDYIQGLEYIRDNKILFSVFYGWDTPPKINCFFENITITQDKDSGSVTTSERNINSYKINLSIKQLKVIKLASETVIRADEIADIVQTQKDTSGATSFEDPKWNAQTYREAAKEMIDNGTSDIAGATGIGGG